MIYGVEYYISESDSIRIGELRIKFQTLGKARKIPPPRAPLSGRGGIPEGLEFDSTLPNPYRIYNSPLILEKDVTNDYVLYSKLQKRHIISATRSTS